VFLLTTKCAQRAKLNCVRTAIKIMLSSLSERSPGEGACVVVSELLQRARRTPG
jgi:hypothetical protein